MDASTLACLHGWASQEYGYDTCLHRWQLTAPLVSDGPNIDILTATSLFQRWTVRQLKQTAIADGHCVRRL